MLLCPLLCSQHQYLTILDNKRYQSQLNLIAIFLVETLLLHVFHQYLVLMHKFDSYLLFIAFSEMPVHEKPKLTIVSFTNGKEMMIIL